MSRSSAARSLARRILRRSRALPGVPPAREDQYAALDTPVLVQVPRSEPATGGPSERLTVLMPHLQLGRMTGGPNTILNLTGRLVERGVAVRYVATFGPLDGDQAPLRAHIASLAGSEAAGRDVELIDTGRPIPVARGDVFLATWWPTAYVARDAMRWAGAGEFVYLVQDYEPGFYAWSSNYALAEATYGFPCRAIFNEALLRAHFAAGGVARFGPGTGTERAIAFDPSVDRGLFRRSPDPRDPATPVVRRLLLYARPKVDRNCFPLALRALRAAVQAGVFEGEEWEFVAIGAELPELRLSDRHVLRPSGWLGLADYARLISDSDLLLSLMLSPHTSYPPLEMAVAGNLVVTNVLGAKTAEALHAISPRIIGVKPVVEDLVVALRVAAATIREGRVPTGEVALPGSWEEAFTDVVPWLAATVRELAGGGPRPGPEA